ncbi:hypothetical protein JVT61DRAFT_7666 [Boletus reticuloceps]|uniref:PARP catalytic domain-containing protein n=1 Tax=Boletus reticuloceps TaxID=495285 RepID=A0A8I3A610_9AGAM|nr:hypothetical protein JVT61DRAFT_7666 [Boletus reticuloceps]
MQVWAPFYVLPPCPHIVFQDARRYWLYPVNHHPSHPPNQQHALSRSMLTMPSNACPQCQRQPKHPDYRFCSVACGQSAARSAPELKYLYPHHELSVTIATQFMRCWSIGPRPTVLAVYTITWTESSQRSFKQYRDAVEFRGQFKRNGFFPGNEQKRFRSTVRACTLGEGANVSPCYNEACWMCETIRCGFEPHLQRKRSVPSYVSVFPVDSPKAVFLMVFASRNGPGIRLGAGIYTSHSSSKAAQYAENIHDPESRIKAMLVCRVVIGTPFVTCQEDPTIRSPPLGYDCVYGEPGDHSAFREDEYVVYNADAIRAAYLVLYETAPGA